MPTPRSWSLSSVSVAVFTTQRLKISVLTSLIHLSGSTQRPTSCRTNGTMPRIPEKKFLCRSIWRCSAIMSKYIFEEQPEQVGTSGRNPEKPMKSSLNGIVTVSLRGFECSNFRMVSTYKPLEGHFLHIDQKFKLGASSGTRSVENRLSSHRHRLAQTFGPMSLASHGTPCGSL